MDEFGLTITINWNDLTSLFLFFAGVVALILAADEFSINK